MFINPDDHVGRTIMCDGLYERDDLTALRAFAGNRGLSSVFIDIGANIGNHTRTVQSV
ncbi:MAG: hypothetical protein IPK97_06770 [Ahniella sp.]|nr:hypothetical protein [Ahniella sp.]